MTTISTENLHICVDDTVVTVSKRCGDQVEDYEFMRPWTRVVIERSRKRNYSDRILLRSKGKGVEVGALLTDDERAGLRRRLKHVISRII